MTVPPTTQKLRPASAQPPELAALYTSGASVALEHWYTCWLQEARAADTGAPSEPSGTPFSGPGADAKDPKPCSQTPPRLHQPQFFTCYISAFNPSLNHHDLSLCVCRLSKLIWSWESIWFLLPCFEIQRCVSVSLCCPNSG